MNTALWDKILQFQFDNPADEYGFSIRLANENLWTTAFTELAITEYKKFMYLAATSEHMVSPSAIIDTVWHQHLIFTQLYHDFCDLVGKQIQHIPSTHNQADALKFRQAKEYTKANYKAVFGDQPKSVWEYNDMYGGLHLRKAKIKIRPFLIYGIIGFILSTVPFYFLLKPLYLRIPNPYFVIVFSVICALICIILDLYNRYKLKGIVKTFDADSFIFQLTPFETVYLKTQKIENVVNGTVNELIVNKSFKINPDHTIECLNSPPILSKEQRQIIMVINELGKTSYPPLLQRSVNRPVFWNIARCADAIKKYINKSQKFGALFYTNFIILTTLLMFSFVRLLTGIVREKPVSQISIVTVVLTIIIIAYLVRLTRFFCTITIPDLYKSEILSAEQVENNWQWNYFLLGSVVLTTAFVPIVNELEKKHFNSDGGSSSSCGSSCGSSCSSCGGCGGD